VLRAGPSAAPARVRVYTARGLRRLYPAGDLEVAALRGIDLDVWEGELVVLLGPSGSGKSTLLNLLGGLDAASGGSLLYRDQDLSRAKEAHLTAYRRDRVGFVFQFYNLIPSLTARENVSLVTELVRHSMRPEEALALVGLEDRLDHFPAQMSGGEQQRVAIARAVAKRPDVLLCDEPTGALDVATGQRVLAALAKINRDLGTTTLIITHNAAVAEMADRVLYLLDGRVARTSANRCRADAEAIAW
jgi:putative ABC transport system ATP-binding protein